MKTAVELQSTGDYVRFPSDSMANYDSTKHNIGPLFFKGTDVWTGIKEFIGPAPIQVARPMENTCAYASGIPYAMKIRDNRFAIVVAENGTANVLRRFGLYIYDSSDNTLVYQGSISFTFPTAAIIRGIRLQRSVHTEGTVQVAGTAVTGSGTNWLTRRVNAGSRIGFGSTDPNAITNWYDIVPTAAIASETALTLTSTAGTIAAGTPYIIEDYSLIFVATCATTTDGGLRVIKGLSLSSACWSTTATATVISLATTVDKIRACYWLKDASTITNLIAAGVALDEVSPDNLTQYAYVLDATSASTVKVFKFNLKAALTVASGISTSAFTLVTGVQTIVGTTSQNHNGRIATLNHGAGIGTPCFYFTTTTRLYRSVLTDITSGSVAFLQDAMLEVPPGGVNTIPASGAMSTLEISDSLDKIIWLSSAATAFRSYVTQYKTDSSQLDHLFLSDQKQVHAGTSDATAYPFPSTSSTLMGSWSEGGMLFLIRQGTTALLNQLYSVPLAAHWGYQNTAPFNVYITPAIATPGCSSYSRLCMNDCQQLGDDDLGITPEGYKVYYRTAGIIDNSGAWLPLGLDYDLSGVAAASSIQFKFEFKILSATCVPGRIFGLAVIYEAQDDIPSELRWNMDDSSSTDGTVGFIQSTSFSVLPTVLQIDYYRSDTNANVLTQLSSSTTNGEFEYHNGSTWVSGIGTNTIGLRRRFRPTSGLPNGVAVYPKLTKVS
jgi:hypothetical protein